MSGARFLSEEEVSKKEPIFLVAKEIVFDFNEKKHSRAGRNSLTASKPGPETFERAVAREIHAGLSRAEAIIKVAQGNPELHEDFVRRCERGELVSGKYAKDSFADFKIFEEAVAHFKKNERLSNSESIRKAAKKYPDLHEEYLWRVNHRGPCWLRQALNGENIPK